MAEMNTLEASSLPDSELYTFIDGPRRFALYFLEGQRLIEEVVLRHRLNGPGLAYFRDVILSIQPMIALIKGGERIGFYIDARDPPFRLKIETAHHGDTRCALVPETFREFPSEMTGVVRVVKSFPRGRPPYESVVHLNRAPLSRIVGEVLDRSYQVKSTVKVSERTDQSLMLHQLPPIEGREDYEYSDAAVASRRDGLEHELERVFERALTDRESIVRSFADLGFRLIASRPVRFRCSCSRERVVANLQLLSKADFEHVFRPGERSIEVVCEYCKAVYNLTRDEIESGGDSVH